MNRILIGDVLTGLASLPDGCVQTCVTSPPYYGLRDYVGCELNPDYAAMAERRIRTTQPGLALS